MAAWPSPKLKQPAGNITGQIELLPNGGLRRVHIAAELGRHDGAPLRRWTRDTDATVKRMKRDFTL